MLQVNFDSTFEDWRSAARNLLGQRVTPGDVIWSPGAQGRLFETVKGGRSNGGGLSVPKAFIKLAEFVACYDDPEALGVALSLALPSGVRREISTRD